MLQFLNVQKYYGAYLAMTVPSFTIGEGVWWLKGENGSGKTTLLKMIAGLHPFSGDIVLNNNASIKKNRLQFIRQVGYAEAESLYPGFLTAKDLTHLYCKTKRGSLDEAIALLKDLHVFNAYEQPFSTYSSGMIKKVSLVLGMIGSSKIILLDEPLITIDADAVEVVCAVIKKRAAEGTSFIITSHQPLHYSQLAFTGIIRAANQTVAFAEE